MQSASILEHLELLVSHVPSMPADSKAVDTGHLELKHFKQALHHSTKGKG